MSHGDALLHDKIESHAANPMSDDAFEIVSEHPEVSARIADGTRILKHWQRSNPAADRKKSGKTRQFLVDTLFLYYF